MPRADGPFKVLAKINDSSYKLELPSECGVSPTFSIADLKPYLGEEDEDIPINDTTTAATSVTPQVPEIQGPITRARARQLNYLVLSFLGTSVSVEDHMLLPKGDVLLLIRNDGTSQSMKDKQWSMENNLSRRGSQQVKKEEYCCDEDIPAVDTPTPIAATPQVEIPGPMTRARARKLNCQVTSFLSVHYYSMNTLVLPKASDVSVLTNQGPCCTDRGNGCGGSKRGDDKLLTSYYKILKPP